MTSHEPSSATATHDAPARGPALVGWRLLALFYDLWPVLAIWMLVAVPFIVVDAAMAGDDRHNIAPFSAMWWLLWVTCWLASGLYATTSWRRGGQTLGMRPWRLRVVAADGAAIKWRTLWIRYAVGTLSLLLGGLGFWWAWFDREKLTWHDRASATRVVQTPKPSRA